MRSTKNRPAIDRSILIDALDMPALHLTQFRSEKFEMTLPYRRIYVKKLTWHLKGGIKKREETAVTRQRYGKHVFVVRNTWRKNIGSVANGVFYLVGADLKEQYTEKIYWTELKQFRWLRKMTDSTSRQRGRPTSPDIDKTVNIKQ
jgi:hypothetical protein